MINITPPTVARDRSIAMTRVGLGFTTIAAVALFADAAAQLLALPDILSAAAEIGYSESPALWRGIGALLLLSTVLYALPRTAFIGALLITGFLGGAIASHVRVGGGAFVPVLAALVLAVIAWGGLWLRSPNVRALVRGCIHVSRSNGETMGRQ